MAKPKKPAPQHPAAVAKPPKPQPLGFGGLRPKGQAALRTAAQGGSDAFNQYLGAHKVVANRLARLENRPAQNKHLQAWQKFQSQYGLKPTGAPAPTTDPNQTGVAPPPAPPGTTMDPDWYRKYVSQFEMPMPKELEQAGGVASEDLKRLGAMPLPSYQEQFNTYKDLMERELDKQTADLTEAYGTRGGRYSSDLTTAANTMRRQGLQDLSAQGIQAMQTLNQQRMQELGGAMNVLQGVGTSRGNIEQNAANTAWQNYLMTTSPPEMMDKMLNWSATFSPPGSVVTTGK